MDTKKIRELTNALEVLLAAKVVEIGTPDPDMSPFARTMRLDVNAESATAAQILRGALDFALVNMRREIESQIEKVISAGKPKVRESSDIERSLAPWIDPFRPRF